MTRMTLTVAAGALALAAWPLTAVPAAQPALQTQAPPVPRPFPGSGQPPVTTNTAASVPTDPAGAKQAQAPPAGTVDAYVFPGAEFVDSFDAGRGQQRYHLYGTNTPYAEVVAFYKGSIKAANREIFRTPPTHQFDLGRFDDSTMAYPPSVVVKDYTWNGSAGYLHVSGTTEKRYRTIVQIVTPQ